ncbi:MAG: copper-binding protein [Pseudomonadota bacterium]
MIARSLAVLAATALVAAPALAEGFLAAKPEKLPDLVIGTDDAGYGVSQKDFAMVTGKGYRLKIVSTGKKECAWVAPEFAAAVWLRKVEVKKVEIKVAQLNEIEMEDEGEAELFFVPVKPGDYTWMCRGLEGKGVTGKLVVK